MQQAITWINDNAVRWCMFASLGLHVLTSKYLQVDFQRNAGEFPAIVCNNAGEYRWQRGPQIKQGLMNKWGEFTWANDDPLHWRICVWSGLNELTHTVPRQKYS